jgi:hypothetical protein
VGLCYFAEKINEIAARNWKAFAKEQYFDSNGLFISIIWCAPIIINTCFIVVRNIMIFLIRQDFKTAKKNRIAFLFLKDHVAHSDTGVIESDGHSERKSNQKTK